QIHTCLVGFPKGNKNGRTVRFDVEGNACFAKRHAHAVHIVATEADIKRLILRTVEIEARSENGPEQRNPDNPEGNEPPRAKLLHARVKLLECLPDILFHQHPPRSRDETIEGEACAKLESALRN